ncbi:hypothetical protein HK405_005405 [Cladochytrium tenue]|nr:hypothetical protein HK405_005405 [Cladochytrium tenue]
MPLADPGIDPDFVPVAAMGNAISRVKLAEGWGRMCALQPVPDDAELRTAQDCERFIALLQEMALLEYRTLLYHRFLFGAHLERPRE